MEAVEEVTTTNDHVHIIKGKRTKRQRPPSPLAAFDITTSNSWSGEGGGGGGDVAVAVGDPHSSQSPTTSAKLGETTEEEEDMANCLILLAQGHSLDQNSKQIDDGALIMEKFNIRRFNEGATTTTNKAGYYVYQCKTCSRCFSSFQALGGHRASHKKLKGMAEEKKTLMLLEDDSPSLNLQMGNKHSYTNNKSKIHECSVCGSEFTSGQALGGHMRRHRSSGTTANVNVSSAMDKILVATQDMNKEKNVLSLDLNLPAPEEERDSKFSFASKQHQQQQQQPLVLSASSLVDCHY